LDNVDEEEDLKISITSKELDKAEEEAKRNKNSFMPDMSIPDTLNTAKDDAVKYVQNLDVQGFGRGNEEETLPRRMSQYSANVEGDREWYADERPLPESTAR
jgi:hypothetical protein